MMCIEAAATKRVCMTTIWDPKHETMDREPLERLQLQRLQEMLARIYDHVPLYRSKLDVVGFRPGDLTSLTDIAALPFTEKDDFRDTYPCGLFAVPMSEVIEIHSSSGTTGKATVSGYTRRDLDTWAELVCRLAVAVGAGRDDVAQISFDYGMFTGGFGLHYGLQRAGVTVLPISAGNILRQIRLMQDFGATILVTTPSYALYLGEVLRKRAEEREKLRLRLGMLGAEIFSEEMRGQIESRLPIMATDNYGLTELAGPGLAGECECRCGMHIAEDHYIAECLDPESGAPVADGEVGELVVTAVTRECSPVLRYRTRDLTTLTREPCECGRTGARMGKVVGRVDDMFIIDGVNIFPSHVESVLCRIDGIEPFYQIVLDRAPSGRDTFEVQVEVADALFRGWTDDLRAFERRVAEELCLALLVRPKVKLVEPGTLERSKGRGKARRVIDHRRF